MNLTKLSEIKAVYEQGANVMRLFRQMEANDANSLEAILAAYDLQAGSYVKILEDPGRAAFLETYTAALAAILDRYSPRSVMEAGVGEATTLANVIPKMKRTPAHTFGVDISWSRTDVARQYSESHGISPMLFVGGLTEIPIEDNAVEVVYTSHSIEPNRGREKQVLQELFRVTRRYLVLLEPSNELGGEATRRHIEEHRYCLNLYRHAIELGFRVVEHRLFEHSSKPNNETALLVIAKDEHAIPYAGDYLACPRCSHRLRLHRGSYFCVECLMAYPVMGGIPCLLASHGIVAARYLDSGAIPRHASV